MCIKVVEEDPKWLNDVPNKFKTQEIYYKAVCVDPSYLEFIPIHCKTQEMCIKALEKAPLMLWCVPDHLNIRAMCERAVEKYTLALEYVPDHLKTKKMRERVVEKYPWALEYVPDWFVKCEELNLWHDYLYHNNDRFVCFYHNKYDRFIKWCNGYQKRKAQKAKIKEELMPIAWHASRWWDWCVPENKKKKRQKNCF